jgi:hypothetical protein
VKPATANGDLPRLGQELVGELIRAFKVRRLYDPGHPQRRGSEEASAARITGILESEGSIELTIESDSLLVGGEAVYEHDEGRESMAFLLHREGLRELSFFHGLTGEELGIFLDDVAAAALTGSDEEFDLVARLWERNFIHIRYSFVEHLMDEAWTPADLEEDQLAAGRDEPPVVLHEEDKSAAEMLRQADPALYFLDDEDMAQLQQELETEKERSLLHESLTCLRELLLTPEMDDPAPILAAVAEVQTEYLNSAEYRDVVGLHKVFEPCLAGNRVSEAVPAFEALRERTLDPKVLEQLAARLDAGVVKDTEVAEYYRAFGRGRLAHLLAHCGDIKRMCQRPPIAEAFVALVGESTAEMRAAIVDDDPIVACHAAYLAGLASQALLLEPLAKALKAVDAQVRREALSAIKQIGGTRALEIIVASVEDEDPTVRLYALRHLVSHRYAPALARVAALLERTDRRSLTERRLLYEAYGTLGGDGVVEELGRRLGWWLGRRGLFRKTDPEEIACILISLGATGSSQARGLVEGATTAKHPLVQRTAFEVLQSLDSDAAVRE